VDPHQRNPCSKNIANATRGQATMTEGSSAVEYVVLAQSVVNDVDAELDKLGA
jgi:hypothetical protein